MDWKWYHSLGLVVIVVAAYLVGQALPASQIQWTWLVFLAALTLFTMLVSHGITGRFWLGWLINEQYRMSLSRLQMFLWTVVILSGFFAAVLANVKSGHQLNALNIAIPEELWLAMGISTTSLVGSPLILSDKKKKKTNLEAVARSYNYDVQALAAGDDSTVNQVKEKANANFTGQLHRNTKPEGARLYDLVRGEETGNCNVLDLSRLQNLFFTLVLVGAYAATLGAHLIAGASKISETAIGSFPGLSAGFVALMGISHAGYLAAKRVDTQPEGNDS